MSLETHSSSGAADHNHGGDHSHGGDHAQGSRQGYRTGFGLSVVLTALAFWLVMSGVLHSKIATALSIMALAIAQIVVHMISFLHMNTKSEGGWTMMALIFTLILVVITLSGSMWVMYNLTANMMPPSMTEMRQIP